MGRGIQRGLAKSRGRFRLGVVVMRPRKLFLCKEGLFRLFEAKVLKIPGLLVSFLWVAENCSGSCDGNGMSE